ncbi:MAG: class I SAM-dependent methyltransferase [Pseudomonadales bacterium]|jgi:ubiquinone/menaquinone biosynthesis C-methylase UbiE|nr:class I SAM-dependent methyltransferase [Pseudomonadales bacterium]MDP7360312.1 class I SAM-dependent methyltransferase [Pseudomonadales bacterium]MDP7597576.1 class I SAM-dependent methyltransferase [Pseudomonadales bacterium]HJN50790.1 class I SAM-dependent methyltransferase [Pseudomonadales bacterium]|tara:strand:- start:1058 stop:1663 length:606 start_codon:yes stop_codon:yes gene_type:complete
MPDDVTREKWDRAAPNFDLMSAKGPEKRWAPWKQDLFSSMDGHILFMALGTGLDIAAFPPNRDITAIDISPKMIEQAQDRVDAYDGEIKVHAMDVHELTFDDAEFDQVFTSCTFCSVPNPIEGLKSLRRVMKPDGELHMFEHTGSRCFPFNLMMEVMTPLTRKLGPEMNRKTVDNVTAAGFTVTEVNHIFLDIVKTIKATN